MDAILVSAGSFYERRQLIKPYGFPQIDLTGMLIGNTRKTA